MSCDTYFSTLTSERRMLEQHGLSNWPDSRELADYVFDLQAKYDAMFAALGIRAIKDVRGRWHVVSSDEVA